MSPTRWLVLAFLLVYGAVAFAEETPSPGLALAYTKVMVAEALLEDATRSLRASSV